MIGGKKNTDFQFYFYFNLPNNNVGGSVNQSIIKKGLIAGQSPFSCASRMNEI